jgi:hypothetical protein
VKIQRTFLMAASFLVLILLAACSSKQAANPEYEEQKTENAKVIKLYTGDPGMYEITGLELEEFGIEQESLVDSRVRLYHKNQTQNFWIENEEEPSRVRFFAAPGESQYMTENIYWLVFCDEDRDCPEPGGQDVHSANYSTTITYPYESLSPPETQIDESYISVIQLEENQIYRPQVEQIDHWFWTSLTAPGSTSIDAVLSDGSLGEGRIRLEVWGATEAAIEPDHHIILRVNGHQITDHTWDGKGRQIIEGIIDVGILRSGENTIEIEAVGDTGVAADITLVDKIAIGYPRALVPLNDLIEFTSPGGEYVLGGFSGQVSVFDITNPAEINRFGEFESDEVIINTEAGHRYWVVGPNGYLSPIRIEPATFEPDLRAVNNGADYVAVGPIDLLEPLQPLLDLRLEQGMQVMAVPLDAIYDQFYFGLRDPEAIRRFMKYAHENWQTAPHYLLLVGDASYDPRGYITPDEGNRLPVFLMDTVYGGQTASDVGYSQLTGDNWDSEGSADSDFEIAVGRIPARNADQVSVLVDKIIEYEQTASETSLINVGSGRILAIADGQGIGFRTDAQNFLDLFPGEYPSEMISPEAGVEGTNQTIIDQMNRGNLIVAYFGHGGINMWGKDRLFSIDDVELLGTEEQLAIVLNFTCLTGLFTHPTSESLAEALLWKENGGAVAVLAPTSLTLPNDQNFLVRALVDAMILNPTMPLGEMLRQAKSSIQYNTPGLNDVTQTFLLFGDPTMKISAPP